MMPGNSFGSLGECTKLLNDFFIRVYSQIYLHADKSVHMAIVDHVRDSNSYSVIKL